MIELTDSNGSTVTLDAPAQRIVAMDPASINIAYSMGINLAARVAAPEALSQTLPPDLLALPEVAFGHATGPNREQLIAAKPDLVLLNPVHAPFASTITETTGAPVLTLEIRTIDSLKEAATTIAKAAGTPAAQETFISNLDNTLQDIKARIPESNETPRILPLFGAYNAYFALLPNSFAGQLIQELGGEVLSADLPEHTLYKGLSPISMETIVNRDPEIIILFDHSGLADPLANLRESSAWTGISAVQDGRVYTLSDVSFVQAPGIDFEESIEELFDMIYPSQVATTEPVR
ncbi:MAG: ABC transporter substrate-binding protein [Planctomycetota bacterium]